MKKLTYAALAASTLFATAMTAQAAGTATGNFTVDVALTAACAATTAGTPSVNFGTYTAFGNTHTAAPTAALTFECTRGLAISNIALTPTALGTGNSFTPGAAGVSTSGAGTIAGLAYTLNVAGASSATTATAPRTGNVDLHTYTITGSMAANQAGQTGTGTSDTLTLTVSY